jgi:hypothetical protein
MLFRSGGLLLALWIAGLTSATAAPPPAQVDACKMIDLSSINAAAKTWFGAPVTLAEISTPGARGGTCGFITDTPKHIDITIFYAPLANASMYGLGQPPPPDETPVSGAGDRAVFDQDANPTNGLKTENLAVLKGNAVVVLAVTLDQKLAFVAKEKLTDFAVKQLVPRM